MINLRYHIVSITAVFLALGIGLTLGSTFLDRVTVDTLKSQLETVQADVDRTQAVNDELRSRVDALEDRDAALSDALGARVVDGHLTDVPVLVVATEGTDEDLVEHTVDTLAGAGADLAGTWWLTNRWLLDDAEEVRDLEAVLDLASEDPDRLRRNGAIRMADALLEAMAPAATEGPTDEGTTDGGTTDEGGTEQGTEVGTTSTTGPAGPADGEGAATEEAQAPAPAEPEVAAALVEAGFLEYDAAPGADGPVVLPVGGLRVVAVSNVAPVTGSQQIALGLIDELTGDAAVPLVAAQGLVDLTAEDGTPSPESDRRSTFVGPLRDGELTRDRVSTVDDVDTAAGLLAVVLAVEDAGDLLLGHYGVGPGAASLLPGP